MIDAGCELYCILIQLGSALASSVPDFAVSLNILICAIEVATLVLQLESSEQLCGTAHCRTSMLPLVVSPIL